MTSLPPGPYFYPKQGNVCVLTWVADGCPHRVGYTYEATDTSRLGAEVTWSSLARLATPEEEAAWRLTRVE